MKKLSLILATLIIFFSLSQDRGIGLDAFAEGPPIPVHNCSPGYTQSVPYFCVTNIVFSSSFVNINTTSPCTAINLTALWNIPEDAKLISFPYTWDLNSGAVGADGIAFTNTNFYQDAGCSVLLPGTITSASGFINSSGTNVNAISGNNQIFAGGQGEVTILLNGNTTIYLQQFIRLLVGCGTCYAEMTVFQPIFYTTN